jgi:hypothetical protein
MLFEEAGIADDRPKYRTPGSIYGYAKSQKLAMELPTQRSATPLAKVVNCTA